MLRRIVGAVALAALFATGVHAQSNPFQESFTFDPLLVHPGQDFNAYAGRFNNADATDLGAAFPTGAATSFQLWCVDELHFVMSGETYNVWVTPLSATNWTHVYVPTGEPGKYRQAAAATTEMVGNVQTAANDNVQYAIWHILGYNTPPSPDVSGYNWGDYNATTVATDESIAATGAPFLSLNRWLVITFDPPTDCVGSACFRQEFIFNDTSRPFETPVPEPGTMAMLAMGLVGMAGAGMRRRKIKK